MVKGNAPQTNDAVRRGDEAARTASEAGERPAAARALPWLLRRKVTIPDRVAGYLHRAQLVERALPTRNRVTVLKAPAGFGKTTLLAECCRRLRQDGIPTAWVSLDEQDDSDEAAILDTYIAFACQCAGLDVPIEQGSDEARGGPESRAEFVARTIEDLGRPFVIALDEPERLRRPEAGSLLDFLLHRGPPNLHLAMACRQLPVGVNVAGAVLEGRATILTTDELQFSRSESAEFFDSNVPRSEMAAAIADSAGWPFALRICRNMMKSGAQGGVRATLEFAENWVESRLFEGLGAEDREFLLDIGLFDWIDAALIDEVLERSDSLRRIDSISVLVGLLDPVGGGEAQSWRLHPLIKDHCTRCRFRETPQRFRFLHRRIAEALMRRGETVSAMRHAVEAGEAALAGELFESAGGVRLWLRQGLVQFQAAERSLSEDVVAVRPRLALARCVALVMAGRLEEGRQRYRTVSATLRDRSGGECESDFETVVDDCIVRGVIALHGGERIGSEWVRTVLADLARLAASQRIERLIRGHLEYGLCIGHHWTAEFETALDWAARARQDLGESPYMTMFVDMQVGQVAMAQGRVGDAVEHYRRARRVARHSYVLDAAPVAIAKVLLQELDLECDRLEPAAEPPRVPRALVESGTPFSAYAAASGTVVDLRLRDEGVDAALAELDEMLGYVRGAGLVSLVRYLSAIRVSMLALTGRIGDAERSWRLDELPEDSAGCLDLAGQSWREMEALSCAHLRVLVASERYDCGRGFARDLRAVASARGLRRTLMRAMALTIALEHRAAEPEAAAGHLREFLKLFADTAYALPLVRERNDCAVVVASFLDSVPDTPCREAAQSLLAAMRRADDTRQPVLSEREREVLRRFEQRQRDNQIAAALGLSTYGVRYHIRNLFAKLEAHTRADAVRRARELGLLHGDL